MRYVVSIPVVQVEQASGTYDSTLFKSFVFPDVPVSVLGVSFVASTSKVWCAEAVLEIDATSPADAVEDASLDVERVLQVMSLKSGLGFVGIKYEATVQELQTEFSVAQSDTGIGYLELLDRVHPRESVAMRTVPGPDWFEVLNQIAIPDDDQHRKIVRALDFFYRGMISNEVVPQLLSFYAALELLVPPPTPGLSEEQIEQIKGAVLSIQGLPDSLRTSLRNHVSNSLGMFGAVTKKKAWLGFLQRYWPALTSAQVTDLIETRNDLAHGRAIEDDAKVTVVAKTARYLAGMIFKRELGLTRTDWLIDPAE